MEPAQGFLNNQCIQAGSVVVFGRVIKFKAREGSPQGSSFFTSEALEALKAEIHLAHDAHDMAFGGLTI